MADKNEDQNIFHKCTPPSTNKKIRNPFDKVLIDKLHKPICSPGMCKIYKKKSNGSFRWDIDQACTLVPADIVVCNSQFEPSPDPALEKIAEEATDRFFSQETIMPSPLIESSKKMKSLLQSSCDAGVQIDRLFEEKTVVTNSTQTVLTLPPELPPELELILKPFCTYTQEQNISGEYEITANGSLRRKLFFEEHSDMEHYDSEQTDDEIRVQVEVRPPSRYEAHTPVVFSPDLSKDLVSKGMKRTFGTPLKKDVSSNGKPSYRNKILDVTDFGEPCFSPIGFRTPKHTGQSSATSSSLASSSISPVTKAMSSDEEKNNFTSPECETMATCLDCVHSGAQAEKKKCFCKLTPYKIKRSTSLKESPPRNRKGSFSFSGKRSLSMSSLHRSRSVQKLDFSMDMSIDSSLHNHSQAELESRSSSLGKEATWSLVEETSIQHLVNIESEKRSPCGIQSSTQINSVLNIDATPIKSKSKSTIRSHEISKIRALPLSPLQMSLDNSLDNLDNSLEDKKIDFNKVDLKFLTESVSHFDYTTNNITKVGSDSSSSFKKVDSGFNENTFYVNTSSYYKSAIKPSELTVTNISKSDSKSALKEISNVHWMRVDSGFKDECSSDNSQFYPENEGLASEKKFTGFHLCQAVLDDKENLTSEDFDRFLVHTNKNEAISMSDTFNDDLTFNCNFSSTPSKNKTRKANS